MIHPLHKKIDRKTVFEERSVEKESSFDWKHSIVLTRRCLHDDWHKIIQKLGEQLDVVITYKPFHARKALLILKQDDQPSLLCQNKEWSTVGKFYVKFERWNQAIHAAPKLLPSYGGWMRF